MHFTKKFLEERVAELISSNNLNEGKAILDYLFTQNLSNVNEYTDIDIADKRILKVLLETEDDKILDELVYYDMSESSRAKKMGKMKTEDEALDWWKESHKVWEDCHKRIWLKNHKDIRCNKCGESCLVFSSLSLAPQSYGLINTSVSGGYYSSHLVDGVTYNFSICEKCLKEIFEGFKVPVGTDW